MKVTVLAGGDSAERDVSIASSRGVAGALRKRAHEVVWLDPAIPLEAQAEPGAGAIGDAPPAELPKLPPERVFEWLRHPALLSSDAVFIGLHGGAGEDGTIQALLEAAGVPYTGTGILGSALAMNKDRSKALFREAGIQTAPHVLVNAGCDVSSGAVREMVECCLGMPVVVKPNCQGSSVGFSFVESFEELGAALEKAAPYGEIVIERYVPGREMTAPVLDGEALPLVEIIPEGGFYDYKRKYTKGASRYVAPAAVEESVAERIRRDAAAAYRALACRDYARIDFRLNPAGEPFCLEVNTLPGMTELSLVPMAARARGMSFEELCERICAMAAARKGAARR